MGSYLIRTILLTVMLVQTNSPLPYSAGAKRPSSTYIDRGACPFECCTYGQWVALTDATLFDRPHGKKIVGRVKKGEEVRALTGEVHSAPKRAVAQYDSPE